MFEIDEGEFGFGKRFMVVVMFMIVVVEVDVCGDSIGIVELVDTYSGFSFFGIWVKK